MNAIMKQLFVYYSDTGNGDAAAEYLKAHGCEIRKITPKKGLPKGFVAKILSGGYQALRSKKSPLLPFDNDFSGFDRVIIGSPVWNGRFSTPVNTLLGEPGLKGKELRFVLYSGSGEAPKAAKRISAEYPGSLAVVLKEPLKHPEELAKLNNIFS